jgi:DNA-binding LacI/PurR family transcriptional regulator
MQYRPKRAARTLRTNRSMTIGLLIGDIQNPFYTALVRGVEDVAQRYGFSLILCNSDEDPRKEQQYIQVLCAEQVAGAIIVPTHERTSKVKLFWDQRIPIVAVDRRVRDGETDAVLVDNVRGAREATAHLLAQGYRRIAILAGPQTTTTGRERLEGYRQALRDTGIACDLALERSGSSRQHGAQRMVAELLDLDPRPEALFTANILLTLGALEALDARGLRIPDDIAMVAFDEMPWAALSSVSLTTVVQPVYDLGSTAAMRLFQRMHNPGALTRQEIVLAPTLCVRGSSRPPARAVAAMYPPPVVCQ